MANTNHKTWRTVSKGTVVLRKGRTGFYLVLGIGLPTEEKPKPYFFSRNIWREDEAISEAMDLISLWEAAHKQTHTSNNEVILPTVDNVLYAWKDHDILHPQSQTDFASLYQSGYRFIWVDGYGDEFLLTESGQLIRSKDETVWKFVKTVSCSVCSKLYFSRDCDCDSTPVQNNEVIINNQNNGKEVNMEDTRKVWVLTDRKIGEDGVITALQVVPAVGDDLAFPALIGRLVRQGTLGQAKFAWLIEGRVPLSVRVRQTRQDGSLGSGWKQVIDRPLPKSATFS